MTRVQVDLGQTPDGRANPLRSGHVFHQHGDVRSADDTQSTQTVAGRRTCLAARVLDEWGTTLRLALLFVLFVAVGMTVVVLVAQWAPVLGLVVTSMTGVGIGAVSGILVSPRRTANL